eukprot:6209029-Pleurochrysis_carterae.AAC.1
MASHFVNAELHVVHVYERDWAEAWMKGSFTMREPSRCGFFGRKQHTYGGVHDAVRPRAAR